MVRLDTQSLSMSDIAHLHPLMQQALRTGAVPSREELARLLGKKVEDIPRSDNEDEKDSIAPEEPDQVRFRARYHAMVDERIADWLAEQQERDAGSLSDFGDRTVPVHVREQIEQDCQRRIQQEWRSAVHQRDDPDDDDGGSPTSWMQSVL